MDDGLPKILSEKGRTILRRGGADGVTDDDLLVLEINARAPGLTPEEGAAFFIALRMEFGEDALYAIRNGHVEFQKREPQ